MPEPPRYRGSAKHKNRPTGGAKGTLCPEWTHNTPSRGYATDPVSHVWADTRAATLFNEALPDRSTGRLYATDRGLAFEAQPSGDGTWHGYPVPWETVPDRIQAEWKCRGKVTARQIKRSWQFDRNDIHWALASDRP